MKIISIVNGLLKLKRNSERSDGLSFQSILLILITILTIGNIVYLLVGNRAPAPNQELVNKIDSLQKVAIKLEQDAQNILDRGMELNNTLFDLQMEVDSLHGMRYVVRKYIHTKIEATKDYEAKQVDSFLKDRYNY